MCRGSRRTARRRSPSARCWPYRSTGAGPAKLGRRAAVLPRTARSPGQLRPGSCPGRRLLLGGPLLRRGDRLIGDRLGGRRLRRLWLHRLRFGRRGGGLRRRSAPFRQVPRRRRWSPPARLQVHFGFGFDRAGFFVAARCRGFFERFFFSSGSNPGSTGTDRRRRPLAFAVALARQRRSRENATKGEHHDQRQGRGADQEGDPDRDQRRTSRCWAMFAVGSPRCFQFMGSATRR